jgi:PKD repeat protein
MPEYCPKCGAEIKKESKFCGKCGSKVEIAKDVKPTNNKKIEKKSKEIKTKKEVKNLEPIIDKKALTLPLKKRIFAHKQIKVAISILIVVILIAAAVILWPRGIGPSPGSLTGITVNPSADFTFIPSGSSVIFSDTSSPGNGIILYSWNFGDGTTSSTKSPAHQYANSGAYTVILTITDGNGKTDTEQKSVSVTIPNKSPSAMFSQSITGLTVVFTDKSSDSDGTIKSWKWSFGDGQTSSQQAPSHSYDSTGTYTVTLTVTDDDEAVDTYSSAIYVEKPNNIPTAQSSASPESGTVPLTVKFTGTGTDDDGYIVSYYWDFGDGGTSPIQSPSHVYINSGTYVAILTVTDNRGATDSVSKTINVEVIKDSDNDGIPDFEDIYDYGDGGIKVTVTMINCDDNADWPWSQPDILVAAGFAVQYIENGTWTSAGQYESQIFNEQSTVYNALTFTVNVDDNIRQVFTTFVAADDDGALGHTDIDLNGKNTGRVSTDLTTSFVFNPRINSIGYFSDDGRLDYNTDEIDGAIEVTFEVVAI